MVLGAGYVGGNVAKIALAAGARVTVLTRNPTTACELQNMGCAVVVADLATKAWHGHISSPDFVLNSVAAGRAGVAGYQQSYVDGAHSIIEWGQIHGASAHLVYTSSTSVYPQGGGALVDEDSEVAPSDERSALLIEAEQTMATQWRGASTVLRLAGIYGPGRHYLLDQLATGVTELPGQGEHHLNLIHRDDIASAIIAAWSRGQETPSRHYNVVDDGRVTKRELVTWLANRLGRETLAFSGQPAVGRRPVRPDRIISNVRLKTELDWEPRYPTFREGYTAILDA